MATNDRRLTPVARLDEGVIEIAAYIRESNERQRAQTKANRDLIESMFAMVSAARELEARQASGVTMAAHRGYRGVLNNVAIGPQLHQRVRERWAQYRDEQGSDLTLSEVLEHLLWQGLRATEDRS